MPINSVHTGAHCDVYIIRTHVDLFVSLFSTYCVTEMESKVLYNRYSQYLNTKNR